MLHNIEFSYKNINTGINIGLKSQERNLYFENLHKFQNKYKSLISKEDNWDIIKKKYNRYEIIYKNSNNKNNITHKKVISRAYFKLNEIIIKYNLLNNSTKNDEYLCLCEAPGGFIENLLYLNKYNLKKIHTMSIDGQTCPNYNLLKSTYTSEYINIIYGVDNTGDLYSIDNIKSINNHLYDNKIQLITGDGGFDISNNYNNQEDSSFRLILCECVCALTYNKIGGSFVVKIFDIFNQNTIELLYIMSFFYDTIDIYKPCISRICNSEKYLICRNFKGIDKINLNKLHLIIKLYDKINCKNITFLDKIPDEFIDKIYQLSRSYVYNQCVNILYIINIDSILLNNNFIINKQIYYGLKWCQAYNMNINYDSYYLRNYNKISQCY